MLELNKWFFVLLLNFLVLLYILNILLFKPLLKLFQERDSLVKDALASAKEMDRKREESLVAMNRELADARNRAKDIYGQERGEGVVRQKEILETANTKALSFIEGARGELKTEAERARQQLRSDVEAFSEEIVRKLIRA